MRRQQAGEWAAPQQAQNQSAQSGGGPFRPLLLSSGTRPRSNDIYSMDSWRPVLTALPSAAPTPAPNSRAAVQSDGQTGLRAGAPPFVPRRLNLLPRSVGSTHNAAPSRPGPSVLPVKPSATTSPSQETNFRSPDSGYDSDRDPRGRFGFDLVARHELIYFNPSPILFLSRPHTTSCLNLNSTIASREPALLYLPRPSG